MEQSLHSSHLKNDARSLSAPLSLEEAREKQKRVGPDKPKLQSTGQGSELQNSRAVSLPASQRRRLPKEAALGLFVRRPQAQGSPPLCSCCLKKALQRQKARCRREVHSPLPLFWSRSLSLSLSLAFELGTSCFAASPGCHHRRSPGRRSSP